MDAIQALAELTEISPQIRSVVVVGEGGSIVGANVSDQAARRLADGGLRLAAEADEVRCRPVAQLEAALVTGSIFVVRDGDRAIVATTRAEPTVGLVFYDLKTALRSIAQAPSAGEGEAPKRARRPRKKSEESPAESVEETDGAA